MRTLMNPGPRCGAPGEPETAGVTALVSRTRPTRAVTDRTEA